MNAIHATLIASAAVNVLAVFGWWNTNTTLRDTHRYAENLRQECQRVWVEFLAKQDELARMRRDWPRRDPVTGRYTEKG